MTFQPGANLYTQGFGSRPENIEVPHLDVRDPTNTDVLFPIGKTWINTVSKTMFFLPSFSSMNGITIANWTKLEDSGATSGVLTLSDGSSTVSPDGLGNISITGTNNQVTVTSNPGSNNLALTLSSTIVTPGSLEVTGAFTADTGATISGGAVDIETGASALTLNTTSNGQVSIGNPSTSQLSLDSAFTAIGILTPDGNIAIGNSLGTQQIDIVSGSGGIFIETPDNGVITICPTNTGYIHAGNSNFNEIDIGAQVIHITSFGAVDGIDINNGSVSPVNIGGSGGSVGINAPLTIAATTFFQGGLSLNNTFVNPGTYTLLGSDCFLNCNTTGTITINLIDSLTDGQLVIIADTAGGAAGNNITINAPAGKNIAVKGGPASSTYIIDQNFGSVTFIVASGDYFAISQGG